MIAMDIARTREIIGIPLCYLFAVDNPHRDDLLDHFCATAFWVPLMPVRFSTLAPEQTSQAQRTKRVNQRSEVGDQISASKQSGTRRKRNQPMPMP
jgi:hypothetical protein